MKSMSVNQIHCTHFIPVPHSVPGLPLRPPLTQPCQDNLSPQFTLPLYQFPIYQTIRLLPRVTIWSPSDYSGPCPHQMLTRTMKCPAGYQLSTISPPKEQRCPQRDQSTLQSSLVHLLRCLQAPKSFHELDTLSKELNIHLLFFYHDVVFYD